MYLSFLNIKHQAFLEILNFLKSAQMINEKNKSSPVVIVHLSTVNSLWLIQIFVYATPVPVIGAKTQTDYDDGYETVCGEVAQLLVAAEECTKRIDAVQYAATIDIDTAV